MINLACLAQKSLGNSVPSCPVPSSDSVLESTLLLRKPFVQCFQLARLALSLDKNITIPDCSTTWRVHKAWCIQILPCQELHSPRGKWGKWGKLSDDAHMTPFVMHPELPTRASSAAMSAIFCTMFAMSFCTSSSRLGQCSKDIKIWYVVTHCEDSADNNHLRSFHRQNWELHLNQPWPLDTVSLVFGSLELSLVMQGPEIHISWQWMTIDYSCLVSPYLYYSILLLHRECQCPWNKTILIPQASKSWSSKAHCFSMSCLDWAKTWKDFTERKRKLKYILKWLENILKSCIFVSGPDNPTEDITQMTQQGCRTLRATTCRYVPPVQVSWRKLTGFVFLTFRISNARFLAWVHRSAAFGPGDLTFDSPKNTALFLVGKESLGASICI